VTGLGRLAANAPLGHQPIDQSSSKSGYNEKPADKRDGLKQETLSQNSDRDTAARKEQERSYPKSPAQPDGQGSRDRSQHASDGKYQK
jgi:hypothetical protein